MPRRVQDIVPGDRRSIRNIPLKSEVQPEPEKTRRKHHDDTETPKESSKEIPIRRIPVTPPPHTHKKKGRGGEWLLIAFIVIGCVIIAGWVASEYFSRATFTIVPKSYSIPVNGTYIAKGTPGASLSYELVILTDSASTTVASTDGPSESTKAQGTVTIYNANSSIQNLVAGSRLTAPDGKIYRLKSSVTVPAARSSATPGSLTTTVVADVAGADYNLTKTTTPIEFTFAGFKGTARYDTVYARLATDIKGGFVGSKKIIKPADLTAASAALSAQLTEKLLAQASTSIPDGYIMYDTVKTVAFSAPAISGNDPTQAVVTVQGTLTGIFFEKKKLIEQLAGTDEIASFDRFSYTSPGLELLDVSIANPKDFSPQKKTSLILRIKGDLGLVGTIPVTEIQEKLRGVSLAETQEILKPYSPVIETGSGELIPPWSKVPKDIERISVIIKEQ
ncbi:MAG: hypothetical protein AB197_01055 [Parcubacteria bacterium C7867-002]|nr:MAG: hypothetical protein AB197_01055 [Parcubacteria bacterium C7867-002]